MSECYKMEEEGEAGDLVPPGNCLELSNFSPYRDRQEEERGKGGGLGGGVAQWMHLMLQVSVFL